MYKQMKKKYTKENIKAKEKNINKKKLEQMKSFCITDVTTLSDSASSVRFPVITTASSREYAKVSTNSF